MRGRERENKPGKEGEWKERGEGGREREKEKERSSPIRRRRGTESERPRERDKATETDTERKRHRAHNKAVLTKRITIVCAEKQRKKARYLGNGIKKLEQCRHQPCFR